MNTASISPGLLAFVLPVGWFIAAYILGSIPEAWLLAKWITGQDLRRMGSGNVGVMNTALSITRWAGLAVFLAEITKGVLAVTIPRLLGADEMNISLSVVGVVIGARWPIWLGFKGGRGNTAGMAAFLLVSYLASAITLAFWILFRLLLKSSFIATRLTILSVPLVLGMVTRSWEYILAGVTLSVIYLGAQHPDSDDHLLIRQRWTSFGSFLTSPPRRKSPLP